MEFGKRILARHAARATKTVVLLAISGSFGMFGQTTTGSASPVRPPDPGVPTNCPPKAKRLGFQLKDSGEVVTGPVCVGIRFNGFRYSAEIGRAVSFSAGPNLATAIATAPAAGGAAAAPGARIDDIVTQLTTQTRLWQAFQARNDQATAVVATAVNALRALAAQSDDLYRSNGADGVITAARDSNLRSALDAAAKSSWAASDNIQASLRSLQVAVTELLLSNPSDADKARLTAIQTQIAAALADMAPSGVNGDKTAAFNRQKAIVDYWNRIIAGLTTESFERWTYIPCGVTVNQNKQIAVRLYTADRSPSLDGQPVALADVRDAFVTVNCPSPFVVSAGVEIRFLKSSTFGLVPSGASGANQFGVVKNENQIPLPIAIAHVRLAEDAGSRIGAYGSFGVAAHVQGSGTSGSAAEYLAGLSVGLFRTMFITGGVHFGQVSSLGGGYKVGDAVPTGVTTVPVTGSYKAGFGLAFTFTKP